MRHPSLEYALVFLLAAVGSFLLTPIARRIALRWGAVAHPRDRDVHAVDTPRLGGLALLGGLGVSLLFADQLPTLHRVFTNGNEVGGVLMAGGVLCALGVLDDKYELDSLTKLAGQITAAGVMVLFGGVQLVFISLPWSERNHTWIVGPDIGVPLTILLTVLAINAVNFIDGLDGLAAGVTGIAALAFFAFSYHLAQISSSYDVALAPTLLAAALAGSCFGFLPHNFAPARIFMGDSGSMLVGLVLSAVAVGVSSNSDPLQLGAYSSLPLALCLLIPFSVMALPLADLSLAILRRLLRRRSPFAPDKEHLHHRLMRIGHSHREAVLILYYWSALLAFGGVVASFARGLWLVVSVVGSLVVFGLLISAMPRLRHSPRTPPVNASGALTNRRRSSRPGRVMGLLLVLAAVVGTVGFTVLSGSGLRSGLSFLGGLVLAGGVFAVGQFNLRMANQISPGLTLAVAMFSYLITVVGLGIVLQASRPTVIDPVAIAVGLVVGVVGWVGRLIDVLRVRPEQR